MAILRFAAEDLGPFRELDIDFSDGNGKPHLGPHIFAGVNGSGKSSILRALALLSTKTLSVEGMSQEEGFDFPSFMPLLRGSSKLGMQQVWGDLGPTTVFASGPHPKNMTELSGWAKRQWKTETDLNFTRPHSMPVRLCFGVLAEEDSFMGWSLGLTAAYLPSVRLHHLSRDKFTVKSGESKGDLGFESTVDNIAIQQWIVDLFSRKAIAQQSRKNSEKFEEILDSLNKSLTAIYGEGTELDIDVDVLEPRLRIFGQALNFSQLPQGVSATLGWIVDFTRRRVRDSKSWQQEGGVLLIDEIEAYLHPRWQRRILPALQVGLPGVQIIVASHSPFVIASCPNAKIHLLTLDEKTGEAKYAGASDAPIGKSVGAILRDIFGVESRFDIKTEDQLKELDDLRQKHQTGKLSPKERSREAELAQELSNRSEELSFLVGPILQADEMRSLEARFLASSQKPKRARSKKAS